MRSAYNGTALYRLDKTFQHELIKRLGERPPGGQPGLFPTKSPHITGDIQMSKSKKRESKVVETGKTDDVTPWNAVFKLPEGQKYRIFGFLVWLLGVLIILWVFRS
jgi:hypothetical protein